MTDDRYCIHRGSLIKQIQQTAGLPKSGDKLPADFETTLTGVQILGRFGKEPIPGTYNVTVTKTPPLSYAKHRVFITCEKCNRNIPTGRLHQHRASCKVEG
jgi:hypothetical protein